MKTKLIAVVVALVPCLGWTQGTTETDTQKLAKSLSSLQRMIQLVRLQKTSSKAPLRSPGTAKTWSFGSADDTPTPIPADVEAQAQRMQGLIQVGSCELTLPDEQNLKVGQDQMQAGVTVFHVELSGKNCPLLMTVTMKGQQVGDRIDASFDLSFRALTEEFQAAADLVEAHQTGVIQVELSSDSAGQKLSLKAEVAGGGVSKTLGSFESKHNLDVDFKFMLPMNISFKTTTEHSFTLNNNNLVLKSEAIMDGIFSSSEKFYFNGQDITKEVYETLSKGIQFIGIDEKKSDEVMPLSCRLRVLDKTRTVLHEVSSCQKDVSQEWSYQGQFFTTSLAYKKNWVEATFAPRSGAGKTIYSLYEEEGAYEKTFGDFVLQSECKPATCH